MVFSEYFCMRGGISGIYIYMAFRNTPASGKQKFLTMLSGTCPYARRPGETTDRIVAQLGLSPHRLRRTRLLAEAARSCDLLGLRAHLATDVRRIATVSQPPTVDGGNIQTPEQGGCRPPCTTLL